MTNDQATADAARAAADAAVGNLLRCWVREIAVPEPADGILRLELKASGARVEAPVAYWSAAGWHRFGSALIRRDGAADPAGVTADPAALAGLLAREAGAGRGELADLVARAADSAANAAAFLAARLASPADPPGTTPFLSGEQALILGHPMHPVPKSRGGLTGP